MKKHIAFMFVLACCLSFAAASENQKLKEVCALLSEHPVTKGNFTQIKSVKTARGSRELKSYGDFIFCPEGIMWKTTKPFPSSMIVGKDFIIQIAADGTKNVTDTSNNQTFASVASTISAVFSNDYDNLTKAFNTSLTAQTDGNIKITLVPRDSTIASVLTSIDLLVSGNQINGIVMTEASENSTSYIFENQTYPKELSKDELALFTNK